MLQNKDGWLIVKVSQFFCCLYSAGVWFWFGVSRRRLLNRSIKVHFYVFFEYIANVSLISVCRAQLHTIMIPLVGLEGWLESIGNKKSLLHHGNSKLYIDWFLDPILQLQTLILLRFAHS